MRNGRLNSAPIIALVLAAACWGAATVITKHVLTDIPALTLLVLQLPASMVGLFLNLIPIFGVGGAYLFLGERLTAMQWIGGGLILLAVVMVLRRQRGSATIGVATSPTGM
jgi:drug/metabolite transporter (DMT)-like permease